MLVDQIRELRRAAKFTRAEGNTTRADLMFAAADSLERLAPAALDAKAHVAMVRAFGRSFLANSEKGFMEKPE